MTIIRTFTEGADRFSVGVKNSYQLDFMGENDSLNVQAGTVSAQMGSGDDFVALRGGMATVAGGSGNDRFDLYSSGSTANGNAGNDHFYLRGGSYLHLDGGSGDDQFTFSAAGAKEQISGGDGDDRFFGNGFGIEATIFGGAGNDAFYGFGNTRSAQVKLAGGAGNDLYRVTTVSGPTVIEKAGEGTDTIEVARGLSYTLGDNIEDLRVNRNLGTAAAVTLTGNDLDNKITGSGASETVDGHGGADIIYGLGGVDYLGGGAGNDRIYGGDGNDGLGGDDGSDTIFGGMGADFMTGDADGQMDVFVYQSAAEGPYDPYLINVDFIIGWDAVDRVDVSAIDANSLVEGVQHFNVVHGDAPSHPEPGTLYYSGDPAGWGWIFIEGYTDADNVPDFFLLIASNEGYPPVTADSFITGG